MGAGGRKLSAAFDAVSELPALAEARERLIGQVSQQSVSSGELAETIESDAGLAIAVIKAANNGKGPPGRTAGIQQAIEALSAQRVADIADRIETYELLGAPGSSEERYERFRRHAVAVRAAADRIAEETRFAQRDELAIAALLHDVGRMVIGEMYGAEFGSPSNGEEPPEERVRRERRELGIDHALVGAVLVRRWGLPASIASAIERHHSPDATALAGYVRLADLVVHQAAGDRVHPESLREAAAQIGLEEDKLRGLVFRYPARRRDPPPLDRAVPAFGPRGRRPAGPRRGQGLQADRPGALALGQHGAHAPTQRLSQDRRGRPGPSRAPRPRPRLDLSRLIR